jgi:hypothetical protein
MTRILFITVFAVLAVAGAAYGAGAITGRDIKDGTVTGKDIKDRSLTAHDFKGTLSGTPGPRWAVGRERGERRFRPAGRTRANRPEGRFRPAGSARRCGRRDRP